MPKAIEMSAAEAAAQVRSRDSIGIPLGPGQPRTWIHALGDGDYEDLTISGALLVDLFAVFAKPGVKLRSGFFGPAERALAAAGHAVDFVPADFRRFAPILERSAPRVMATAVAPPDADGNCSLALHAGATVAELQRAGRDPDRLLVAEMHPDLPRTVGVPPEHPNALTLDEIDLLVPSEHPVVEKPPVPPSAEEQRIAEHIRPFVVDGATLQTGIGGVPNAVATLLAEGPGGDYGVHSEMFTDGLMALHEAGKVTNRKGLHDGYSVTTFAFGSRALYDWLDGREDVRFLPVDQVNTPSIIARNRAMTAINGALAIDLFGQIAADTLGGRQHSGIGGHEDFSEGAGIEGQAILCLPSTATVDGKMISRIEARLGPLLLVTTPRHQLDVVATEYGAIELIGMTVEERAQALIQLAHPDFRDELAAAWSAICG